MDNHHLQSTMIMNDIFRGHTGITLQVTMGIALKGGYVCGRITKEQLYPKGTL